MTERKRKTKLDFMGYARVSGALPVDLGHGPLADERMQQLALPEDQWMGGGEVDQALSDLSRKFMAEVDAGNNPLNLQLGGENPELAEFMMGQMTSQEWHQCRDYLQQHWTDAALFYSSLDLNRYHRSSGAEDVGSVTAVPKNNVAIRFRLFASNIYLFVDGVVFTYGSDLFPLDVDDLPQSMEIDDLLKEVTTRDGHDCLCFERGMFNRYSVAGDLGNLLGRSSVAASHWLMQQTCPGPGIDFVWQIKRHMAYFDSIERKWDDLLSEPTFSNASSIFKEMDFVTGFPAVAYRRSPVIAPMKFGLIDQGTISTLRRHLLREIVHTSGTR